jgi:hypothetical protein
MKNLPVWTLGTNAGCGARPIAAALAGTIVTGLVEDRSRRVCSQPV